MKYLDILKNYDKAIVTESEKLNLIYKQLVNEGCCNANDKSGKKTCVGEEVENEPSRKTMTEFDESMCDEDKMRSPEEYYGTDVETDVEQYAPQATDGDTKQEAVSTDDASEQETMTRDQFFQGYEDETTPKEIVHEDGDKDTDTAEDIDDTEVADGDTEPASTEKTHSEVADGDDESASAEEATDDENNKSTVVSASELFAGSDDSQDDATNESECVKENTHNFNNAQEWLDSFNESEEEDKGKEDKGEDKEEDDDKGEEDKEEEKGEDEEGEEEE